MLNKIVSGVDSCSEHSLNIHRGQPSGPGDLSVFSLYNSSNTIEACAVIIISSNLGTETSTLLMENWLNFHLLIMYTVTVPLECRLMYDDFMICVRSYIEMEVTKCNHYNICISKEIMVSIMDDHKHTVTLANWVSGKDY